MIFHEEFLVSEEKLKRLYHQQVKLSSFKYKSMMELISTIEQISYKYYEMLRHYKVTSAIWSFW